MNHDPFPTQGRLRGRLEEDLAARELRRTSVRRTIESADTPVKARTYNANNVAGNERVLRAIPVSAMGVAGAIPNTRPDLYDYDRHPGTLLAS